MTAEPPPRPWLKWPLIILFLLWVGFTLAAYYWAQNAYAQPLIAFLANAGGRWLPIEFSAAAPLQVILDLLVALWFSLTALGLGLWLLHRYDLPDASPLARAILAT